MDIVVVAAINAWRDLNRNSTNQAKQRRLEKALAKLNSAQRAEFDNYTQVGTP